MIKKKKSSSKINWFWTHRRNSTILQLEMIARGFRGKGYTPFLNFYFDNQILYYKPEKGVYLYYDKDQINKKMYQILKDIKKYGAEKIVNWLHTRTKEFFGHTLLVTRDAATTNLELCSNKEIKNMFEDYRFAFSSAPMLTVQLWGIEACWLEESPLTKELKEKLRLIDKKNKFVEYKIALSATNGKTIAYAEREEFLKMLIFFQKNKVNFKKIKGSKFEKMLNNHIRKYAWITFEYKSDLWSKKRWIEECIKTIKKNPLKLLKKQIQEFESQIIRKNQILKELKFSKKTMNVLNVLDAFNKERDWAKGKTVQAFLVFEKVFQEMARRLGISKKEMFMMTSDEIITCLMNPEKMNSIIDNRRNNEIILVIKKGNNEISTEIKKIFEREKIEDMTEKKESTEFKGVPASPGYAKGRVRVIDNANEINTFIEDEILVTYMTTMEFTPLFPKAKAIICDEGGVSSHAAIVSREFKKPCIVGTKIATRVLKTGDLIEINATKGLIKIIK